MNKLTILTAVFASILISCGGKDADTAGIPPMSEARILAVHTRPDSTKALSVMLRVITKKVEYDSAARKDRIVIDTAWGYPQENIPLLDSLGKPVMDSLGKPKLDPVPKYLLVKKGTVNWRVENISVDSLLKADK
jgi:hypothetical protein